MGPPTNPVRFTTRLRLTLCQAVFPDEEIAANRALSTVADLDKLGGQALDEVLQPPCHVHAVGANALDRPIEGGPIAIVVLADGEQPLEVVPGPIEAERGEQSRRAAIAVEEWVDVDEPELSNTAHDDGMNTCVAAEPRDQLRHQDRHVVRGRRGVDCLASRGVDHEILNSSVLSRPRSSTTHAFDQALVDLPDESLADRAAVLQVLSHEVERAPVVQEFPDIVRVGAADSIAA